MAVDDNKALVRRFLEALDSDELDVLGDICAPDVAEDWRTGVSDGDPWSDQHLEIKKVVAEADDVMVVLHTEALVTGEFHGIPPADKRITNTGAVFFHVQDGKIAEVMVFFDDLNIVTEQLGATITPPASTG